MPTRNLLEVLSEVAIYERKQFYLCHTFCPNFKEWALSYHKQHEAEFGIRYEWYVIMNENLF